MTAYLTLQEKFASARACMNKSLIERHEEIDLTFTALLSGENFLMVGPPGTAKSMLADEFLKWIDGAILFSALFNKFTTPEELFGPVSLSGLKKDEYRRVTRGKMPEANVIFADEIFKGSTSILNTTLRIFNEGEYDNGTGGWMKTPKLLVISASNEWPGGEGQEGLDALFDRFLIRKAVRPISTQAGRKKLLWSKDLTPAFESRLTMAELEQARKEVEALEWGDEAKSAMMELIEKFKVEGIVPGDRRLRKSIRVVQAAAWLAGAPQVEPDHLGVLSHTLWNDPGEQAQKAGQVIAKCSNPVSFEVNNRLNEAHDIINKTDASDLAQAATATTKLENIHKSLKALKPSKQVHDACKEIIKLLRDLSSKHIRQTNDDDI